MEVRLFPRAPTSYYRPHTSTTAKQSVLASFRHSRTGGFWCDAGIPFVEAEPCQDGRILENRPFCYFFFLVYFFFGSHPPSASRLRCDCTHWLVSCSLLVSSSRTRWPVRIPIGAFGRSLVESEGPNQ